MTARWEKKGKWEAYRADFSERFANRPHVVRASTLGLEDYADTYLGERGQQYLQAYDRPEPWCCWISFGGPGEGETDRWARRQTQAKTAAVGGGSRAYAGELRR